MQTAIKRHIGVGVLGMLAGCALFAADPSAGLRAFQEGDYKTARREFKAGADQGEPNAEYNLAVLYLEGLGVVKDPDEAFRLFRLAADQGHLQAEFRVGELREKGWGAPPNYTEAQRWFQKAADGGDAEAAAVKRCVREPDELAVFRPVVNLEGGNRQGASA